VRKFLTSDEKKFLQVFVFYNIYNIFIVELLFTV
jgi:hypothetical protein